VHCGNQNKMDLRKHMTYENTYRDDICTLIYKHIYLNDIKYKVQDYDLRHDNWWSREHFSNQITDADEAC
jgi:hypothetical protein